MTAKSVRDPVIVTVDGRTIAIEFTPCSPDHELYIQDGYLPVSCPRCVLKRIDPAAPSKGTPR